MISVSSKKFHTRHAALTKHDCFDSLDGNFSCIGPIGSFKNFFPVENKDLPEAFLQILSYASMKGYQFVFNFLYTYEFP